MRIIHSSIFFLAIFGFSCTDGSDFGTVGKKLGIDGDESDTSDDDEDDTVEEPTEIAGAFLYCAFWEDDPEIESKAQAAADLEPNSPESVINGPEVACGFYQSNEPFAKVDDKDLTIEWSILANDKEAEATNTKQDFDANFHTIVRVPIEKSGGAIVGKYRGETSNQPGYRMKDIASITESGAKNPDFDLQRHLRNNRSATIALIESPPQNITAAGQEDGCDTMCAIVLGVGIVAKVIQPAAQPETQESISNSANSSSHDGHHRYREVSDDTPTNGSTNGGKTSGTARRDRSTNSQSNRDNANTGASDTGAGDNPGSANDGVVSAGGEVTEQPTNIEGSTGSNPPSTTADGNTSAPVQAPDSGIVRSEPVTQVNNKGKPINPINEKPAVTIIPTKENKLPATFVPKTPDGGLSNGSTPTNTGTVSNTGISNPTVGGGNSNRGNWKRQRESSGGSSGSRVGITHSRKNFSNSGNRRNRSNQSNQSIQSGTPTNYSPRLPSSTPSSGGSPSNSESSNSPAPTE
jgi:hypothetical protein